MEQPHLPGIGPKKIPKVHTAAQKYYDAIRRRLDEAALEHTAEGELADAMKEAGITRYHYADISVEPSTPTKQKFKVTIEKDAPADEEKPKGRKKGRKSTKDAADAENKADAETKAAEVTPPRDGDGEE